MDTVDTPKIEIFLSGYGGYGKFFKMDTVLSSKSGYGGYPTFSARYKYITSENICQIYKINLYDIEIGFFQGVYPYERHRGYGWIRWLCKFYMYFFFSAIFCLSTL